MMRALLFSALLSLGAIVPEHAGAADIEVDAELVLAVDVSRSMTAEELEIQRRGYAEALASEPVIDAITDGLIGRIALRYVEWSGDGQQRVIVDWTLIAGRADAEAVALKLTASFNQALRRTSISSALDHSVASFEENGFTARRRIVDVSGDGPNNDGGAVLDARQRALAAGVVINGLPLMTRQGMGVAFQLKDLDEYYRQCVVGGPNSFVIPVTSWEQFPAAVRQKLVLELAGTLPVHKATISGATPDGYDCLIGEKLWRRFMQRYRQFEMLQP